MPFYEYLCTDCNHVIEVQHKMAESPSIECQNCGSKKTEKLISSININTHTGKSQTAAKAIDQIKKGEDMKSDLRENYGIHEMAVNKGQGHTYETIYKEIKGNSKDIKDGMIEKRKANLANTRKKQVEQMQKLAQTRDKRIQAHKEHKAKAAYESRAIDSIKSKPKE